MMMGKAELLRNGAVEEEVKKTGQMSLFPDSEGNGEPVFLRQYIFDYRKADGYAVFP